MKFQSMGQPTYCPTMMSAKPFQVRHPRYHEYFWGLLEVIDGRFRFRLPGLGEYQLKGMDEVVARICAVRSWVEHLAEVEGEVRKQEEAQLQAVFRRCVRKLDSFFCDVLLIWAFVGDQDGPEQ